MFNLLVAGRREPPYVGKRRQHVQWRGGGQNYFDAQIGSIIEGDIMLDTDAAGSTNSKPWVNGQVRGRYDIWSVVAHEMGHLAGFGHVSNQYNVMWTTQLTNDIEKRSLGLGDARENNAKY